MSYQAVITGDIVNSTGLLVPHRQQLEKDLWNILEELGRDFHFRGEVFRGDSLQCLLPKAYQGLRVALLIKTFIRSIDPTLNKPMLYPKFGSQRMLFDVRISLAVGSVSLFTDRVVTSDGEAFQLSGRRLDEMKKLKQTFSIISNDPYRPELNTESVLLDAILAKTSPLQCKALFWKLRGNSESRIAEKLGIQQAAVNQRARGGGWHAIETLVKRFEEIYGAI